MDEVLTFSVPAPTLKEQKKIASELDEIELEMRSLLQSFEDRKTKTSELRKSILLTAFGGRR
jgi:restriction endonuclease S subunit